MSSSPLRLELSQFQMMDAQEVFGCITPAIAKFVPWEPAILERVRDGMRWVVIPTKSAIIPAAVGVDIGYGMMALQMHADHLPDNLHVSAPRSKRQCRTVAPTMAPRTIAVLGRMLRRITWTCGQRWGCIQSDPRQVSQAEPCAAPQSPGNARHREPLHRGLPRRE